MKRVPFIRLITTLAALLLSAATTADTFVIPFSEIRDRAADTGDPPDDVIRAYLVDLLREELDKQGFSTDGTFILGELPVDEYTDIIATDCNLPRPYAVHTDATTASITVSDQSSIVLDIPSIRSISLDLNLVGSIAAETTAWVRWGQDIPFVRDCATINTDHGIVGWIEIDPARRALPAGNVRPRRDGKEQPCPHRAIHARAPVSAASFSSRS